MSTTKKVILAAVAVAAVAVAIFLSYNQARPNRVVLENSTGVELTDVTVSLESKDGKWSKNWSFPVMAVDDRFVMRHGHNDTSAELRFTLRGTTHEYNEHYIDLWTGQGWVFEIQPDGDVGTRYDDPR